MSYYETPDGERFHASEIFGRFKSGTWERVASEGDERTETWVVRTEDGDLLELNRVEGSSEPSAPDRPYGPKDAV